MKAIINIGSILLGLLSLNATAQTDMDAVRYSNNNISGSARFNAMGGAFTALGGDLTCTHQNPAGLGVYRRSEISGGLNINTMSTASSYNGTTLQNSKSNFNLSNIGFLFYNELNSEYGWKSNYFAFNYNRTHNFANRVSIEGTNTSNSLVNQIVDNANQGSGTVPDNLDGTLGLLAFNSYLIDLVPGSSSKYFGSFTNGGTKQSKSIATSGYMAESAFSFGGNYKDKLFLGATLGINSIHYTESASYTEEDVADTLEFLKSFTYGEKLNTSGMGVNFKAGFIYKPIDWLRFGASFSTPTFYGMSDSYNTTLDANWDSIGTYTEESDKYKYEYSLRTPLKFNTGLALILGKKGLISMDYEMNDYRKASFNSDNYSMSDVNNLIYNKYVVSNTVRVGGELRLDPFVLRGGYSYSTSPYNKLYNTNAYRNAISGGIGYREESFFIDLSLVLSNSKELYYLYSPTYVNPVTNKFSFTSVNVSTGFKF